MIFRVIMKRMPVVLIIVVSIFAAISAFIQSEFTSRAEDARKDADKFQWIAERIEDRARNILDGDGRMYLDALDSYQEGAFLALKYSMFRSNLTEDEKTSYQFEFYQAMASGASDVRSLSVGIIHKAFTEDPTLDVYQIATQEKDGYNYSISRADWEIYTPIYNVSKDVFLSGLGLGGMLTQITDLLDFLDDVEGEEFLFWEADFDNIYSLIRGPLWVVVDEQRESEDDADRFETLVEQITIGVGITTLATVLASAMASRIDDKKSDREFSIIQSELKHDPFLITSGRDIFAYIGLILAVLISAIGLIAPIIYLII
ncbi:MAG: hypothetical protein ACFFCQ_06415 [Promethearchaeota archaeon]